MELRADSPETLKQNKTPGTARKIRKAAGNILFAVLMVLVVLLAFVLVQNRITGGRPKIAGHYVLIVLSGSMAPTFDAGSVALVRPVPVQQIRAGDIVTFSGFAGSSALTTHRVVGMEGEAETLRLITKGDANDANDPDPIPVRNVVGKVTATIPLVGFVLAFFQSWAGLPVFLFPGAVLLILQGRRLYEAIRSEKGGNEAGSSVRQAGAEEKPAKKEAP